LYIKIECMLTREQKKEWAKLIFLRDNLTQKEIALKVGTTEKTLSKWINTEDWNKLKSSLTITKEETLRRFYNQVNEITKAIETREDKPKYADSKETDTLVKLTAAIKNLETETSVREVMEVFKNFINWIRPVDLDKAKEITEYCDNFIKTLLR
jgi:transcriptional regulator with XRE-family HTH domain